MDIRLEEMPFEFQGKTYKLRCNMNVLADVQELHNGNLRKALEDDATQLTVTMEFLVAMMNDYSDEMGWEEKFTARSLGRYLIPRDVKSAKIFRLVANALFAETSANSESEDNSKN